MTTTTGQRLVRDAASIGATAVAMSSTYEAVKFLGSCAINAVGGDRSIASSFLTGQISSVSSFLASFSANWVSQILENRVSVPNGGEIFFKIGVPLFIGGATGISLQLSKAPDSFLKAIANIVGQASIFSVSVKHMCDDPISLSLPPQSERIFIGSLGLITSTAGMMTIPIGKICGLSSATNFLGGTVASLISLRFFEII